MWRIENCKNPYEMLWLERIDFRLLGVTRSLKILTAFDNLLMLPQSARQITIIEQKKKSRQFEVFDLYKLQKSGQMFARLRFSSGGCARQPRGAII